MRIIGCRRGYEWHSRWKHGHEHVSWYLWGTHGKYAWHERILTVAILAIRTTATVSIICTNKYDVDIVRGHTHCNNLCRSPFFGLVGGIAMVVRGHSCEEGPLHHSHHRGCHRNWGDPDLHSNSHCSTRVLYVGRVARRNHLGLRVDPLVAGCPQHILMDVSYYGQEGLMNLRE